MSLSGVGKSRLSKVSEDNDLIPKRKKKDQYSCFPTFSIQNSTINKTLYLYNPVPSCCGRKVQLIVVVKAWESIGDKLSLSQN